MFRVVQSGFRFIRGQGLGLVCSPFPRLGFCSKSVEQPLMSTCWKIWGFSKVSDKGLEKQQNGSAVSTEVSHCASLALAIPLLMFDIPRL